MKKQNHQYKVGDKVRVWRTARCWSAWYPEMEHIVGQTFTISQVIEKNERVTEVLLSRSLPTVHWWVPVSIITKKGIDLGA